MSETKNVIEVMARALAADLMGLIKDPYGERLPDHLWREPLKRCGRILSALHAAGYRLAGPGECVVPKLYDPDAVNDVVWGYWVGRNGGEGRLNMLINAYLESAAMLSAAPDISQAHTTSATKST